MRRGSLGRTRSAQPTMKLYIMRHGPAEDEAQTGRDADRALTLTGRDRVRSVANLLVAEGEAPLAILTSPLVRALQTAEIVASVAHGHKHADKHEAASEAPSVEIRGELAPGSRPRAMLGALVRAGRKRIMVVGHEPDLSVLVEELVGATLPEGMLKAMVVGIKLTPDPAPEGQGFTPSLAFVLHPKKLALHRA